MQSPAHQGFFHLHDVRLEVVASARAFPAVNEVLEYKGIAPGPPASDSAELWLEVREAAHLPALPADARHLGGFGPELETYLSGEDFLIAGPRLILSAAPASRRLSAVVLPAMLGGSNDARQTLYYALTYGLAVLLRGQDYFGLHAAALAVGNAGVLLVGSSDSGKTTTALTLVRRGWDYVTDDALLIRERSGRIEGLSFRRDFCVDPEAASLFPELGQRDWPASLSDPSKWRVDVAQIFDGRPRATCVPRLILAPKVVASGESHLEPMATTSAFQLLATQSSIAATPIPRLLERQMHTIGRLLHQAKPYSLSAGRDVLERPESLNALLQDALRATAS